MNSYTLLAQTSAAGPSWLWPALIIAGVVALVLLIVLTILLTFRGIFVSRRLLHAERMRSLEAGIPWEPSPVEKSQSQFMDNAFWISFWLVTAVPSAAFAAATTATQEMNKTMALAIVIWSGAALASVAAVTCATILMIYSRSGQLAGFLKKLLRL